ncbi:oxidoreductase [Schlegelella sp. S2-27]|uniref:Oxidoreductase n=1 Tax=Caldimonas mangrovi TaxID=2944811 RepID=A0ABT0YHD1_9BURK|nr:oxidoreductase [Caldimonas mangrovi]MCM5678103.1 oxidoreductase [Caldimonas mangrovi]
MSVLRVGLIGYGYASKTFHAPLIAGVPGLQLVAVSSSDAAKVHADWPALPVEPDAQALVARHDIDLVVVPTPNDTHHALAKAALLAGKHVVVDKPFTVTLVEAQELEALARTKGCVLSVFHNRRWDADFLTLQGLLGSGLLGRVVHFESHFDRYRPQVRARWRERAAGGGGLWYDLGPHLLDQALQLFGLPEAIWLDLALQRDGALADDYFHAQLRYGGLHEGLRVILHASALVPAVGPRFTVHGTRGSFVKHGLDPQEDRLKAGARPQLDVLGDWGHDPLDGLLTLPESTVEAAQQRPTLPGNYLAYYAAVRDAILHGTPNPVPAAQAMQVMALIEAGLHSHAARHELPVPRLAH